MERTTWFTERTVALAAIAGALLGAASCGDVIIDPLEYGDNGTASKKIYEARDNPDNPHSDRVKGPLQGFYRYHCELTDYGRWEVVRVEIDAEGNTLRTDHYAAKACSDDGLITQPEQL